MQHKVKKQTYLFNWGKDTKNGPHLSLVLNLDLMNICKTQDKKKNESDYY